MTGSNPLFPQYLGFDLSQYVIVGLVSLGMGLAFLMADRRSPTSQALALTFMFVGLSIDLGIVVGVHYPVPIHVFGWFGLMETFASLALLQWILLVRRTVPAGTLDTRTGDFALRAGQVAAVLYGAASVLLPEIRVNDFLAALDDPDAFYRPGFWIFMAPMLLIGFFAMGSLLLLLNRKPDPAERVRVIAMMWAVPLLTGSLISGLEYAALLVALGLIIFLIGAVEYHVLQGQRGQFMSRFLSPQVAKLVAERGLDSAMQVTSLEITIVCCDLRGFTAYAQARPSKEVLGLLGEYYDAVGRVVAEFGATIKDYAGDGILVLVGAPLPQEDHALAGLELARKARDAVQPIVRKASLADFPLGLGIGVASGPVTVGVIGSSGRFEYTAVGPAVNLASRLCEQAGDGEILVAGDSIRHCGDCSTIAGLEQREPLRVKGYAEPVALFNLAPQPAGA